MRSVECPAAAAAARFTPAADSGPRPAADSARRRQVSGQVPPDSDLALASALLAQPRELDSQHLLLQTTYSYRGHFFPATPISSASTVVLDFTIFMIISAF